MTRIELDASLLTGHADVDEQHAELFAMFSDLHEAARSDGGFLVLRNVLDRLAAYVDTHFGSEQRLMAEYGYPADVTLAHIDEHHQLRHRTHELLAQYRETRTDSIMPVALFLAEWMSDHIRQHDARLAAFIAESNA